MPGIPPGPPPPPPAPTRQGGGGGGGGGGFVQINGGGPPRPDVRPPGPPPPPAGFLPPRQPIQSTRVVDITPRKLLDEDACRKRLTSYEAYTIRKNVPRDSKDKPTWAKSEISKEPLSQDDISKAVKRLNEGKRSVQDKKGALMNFQQGQVNRLVDELMSGDNDINFEWSLAQLDQKFSTNKKGQKETSTITIFVKRAPLKDLNVIGLFNAIERNKAIRLEQMNRPPPHPELGRDPGNDPIIDVHEMGGKMKGKFPGEGGGRGPKLNRPKKKYHDHSSSSSQYSSSDSESDSEYTSDGHTTISTHSDRYSRKYSHKGRSQSRRREHRKKYYVDDRILSPEPPLHRNSLPYGAVPRYVPEVPSPRGIPTGVPQFDPVAAAYQAGKIDADAERFGLDRYPRRSIAEPAALVSYARPAERVERIYSDPGPRYMEEVRYVDRGEDLRDVRYVDEREDDYIRREERRRRDAEDYIDRRSVESRLEPRIVYTNPNPFTPMRSPRRYSYTPSHSTRDDYR